MERPRSLLAAITSAALALGAPLAVADDDSEVKARLEGAQEVPSVITGASGRFKARVQENAIEWHLRYEGLEANVLQAHIHVGQRSVNGGISVFLCANPPIVPPPGTLPCPPRSGEVSGTATAANVIGPAGQGVSAGEFADLVRAIKRGVTYANVHSATFPGGEIRGQIRADDD